MLEDGGEDFGSPSTCDGAWDSELMVTINLLTKRLQDTLGIACAPLSFVGPVVFAMLHLSEELHDETVVGDCDVPTEPGHPLALLLGDLPHLAKVDWCCLTDLPGPDISGWHLPLIPVAEKNLRNKDTTTTTLVLTKQRLVHMALGLHCPHPL